MDLDLTRVNKELRNETPEKILEWAVSVSKRPILTTNFGPYEAAILHACVKCQPDIRVVWCDSGYNTDETYQEKIYAATKIKQLEQKLKVHLPVL